MWICGMIHLVHCDKAVQKCQYVRRVVRAHIGVMEKDCILCNGSAKGDVMYKLPWDSDYTLHCGQ